MISMHAISGGGDAAKYFCEQNGQQATTDGRAEYYAQEDVRSSWGGSGAALAGYKIGGTVDKQDMIDVLDGKVRDITPEGYGEERQLGRTRIDENGERYVEHRSGWDFTFSSPKSVSIEAEVFDNKDARNAHEAGNTAAMDFLEKHAASARINGEHVQTGNLVIAKMEHSLSRNLDPDSHTHNLIANVTYHEGKAYSVSNEKLFDLRHTADVVAKNEEAHHLQKAGFQLEFDGKGNFEIAGYSREQIVGMSSRTEEIYSKLTEAGIDPERATFWEKKLVSLELRADKSAPDTPEQQREQWQEKAGELGISQAKADEKFVYDKNAGNDAVEKAVRHLYERESAWNEKDLWKAAATFSEGRASYSQLEQAVADKERSGELVRREDGKYTSKEAIQDEKTMGEHLEGGKGTHQAVMTAREFDKALEKFEERKTAEQRAGDKQGARDTFLKETKESKGLDDLDAAKDKYFKALSDADNKPGFKLTDEQRQSAAMMLTGNDRFQGVQGLAGTGKTTMLEFVREAAESKGWKVEGFSNGAAQAQKMEQESGIKSTTTACHLIDHQKDMKAADLAQKALDTYKQNSTGNPFTRVKPDFKALEKGVSNGSVTKDFVKGEDGKTRVFYTDKKGTWTPGLHKTVTSNEKKNLIIGKVRYAEVKATGIKGLFGGKEIIRTDGGLKSTLAGVAREKLDARNGGFIAKVADKYLTRAEQWHKAGVWEGAAAKRRMIKEGKQLVKDEMSALKGMVEKAVPAGGKVLRVMDEASMSGQKQFNAVVSATEQSGVRTVFLGDKLQHQSVEAGKAFEKAQQHMPVEKLETINRQKTEHMKDAVQDILAGNHGEALKKLDVRETRNAQQAVADKWEGKARTPNEDRQFKSELKNAAREDSQGVIREIASDYAGLDKKQQSETLVITSSNADRMAINNAIRSELKARGELQGGRNFETLGRSDKTSEQLNQASSYQKGEVVQFTSAYKLAGVEKGEIGEVVRSDGRNNTVTLRMDGSGKEVTFRPEKIKGKEVFLRQEREFSPGDSIRFTKNDKDQGFKNNEQGRVESANGDKLTVRMENGDKRVVDTASYKNLEHGYASTSHGSQGQTVNKVMVHHNTEGRHGDRETYVNVTRGRFDAIVYTQDKSKAAIQSGIKMDKETALPEKVQEKEKPDLWSKSESQEVPGVARKAERDNKPDMEEKIAGGHGGKPYRGDQSFKDFYAEKLADRKPSAKSGKVMDDVPDGLKIGPNDRGGQLAMTDAEKYQSERERIIEKLTSGKEMEREKASGNRELSIAPGQSIGGTVGDGKTALAGSGEAKEVVDFAKAVLKAEADKWTPDRDQRKEKEKDEEKESKAREANDRGGR